MATPVVNLVLREQKKRGHVSKLQPRAYGTPNNPQRSRCRGETSGPCVFGGGFGPHGEEIRRDALLPCRLALGMPPPVSSADTIATLSYGFAVSRAR